MKERFEGVQGLRGVAALLVAGFHLAVTSAQRGLDPGPFRIFIHGEFGVDIFFVISGFIIFHSAAARSDGGAAKFALSRFLRIFPPYWAVLSLYIGLNGALALATGEFDRIPAGRELAVSALLLPVPGQIITIAWTLSVELIFYLIFAMTYFRFGTGVLLAVMAIWVGASEVYSHAVTASSPWLGLLFFTGNAEFLFGIAIALALRSGKLPLPGPALAVGLLLSFALLAGRFEEVGLGREVTAGIPAALVIYGIVGLRPVTPRVAQTLGDASYLLYLLHLLVYAVAGRVLGVLMGADPYGSPIAMLGMLLLAVGVSVALNRFGEKPYQRWYHRRISAAPGVAVPRI